MLDLLLILIAIFAPTVLDVLGVPQAVTAPMLTASLLVWPGYVVTLLVWPKAPGNGMALRLGMAPFFSIIVLLAVSLTCWFTGLEATASDLSLYTLITVVLLLDVVAVMRFFLRKKMGATRYSRRELAGAMALFGALCLVFLGAAIGPQGQAAGLPQSTSVTFYRDPTGAPRYDAVRDEVELPLVISNGSPGMVWITLRGNVRGQDVEDMQVQLAPGETQQIQFGIPRAMLDAQAERPVDLEAEAEGMPAGKRPALRLWLKAPKADQQKGMQ